MRELVSFFRDLGVKLRTEEGRLLFDAPKGVLTPDHKVKLKAHKEALIAYLARMQRDLPEPGPMERGSQIPLSFAQLGMWLVSQMEGAEQAYHSPIPLRIDKTDDAQLIIKALEMLVARHEVLRTCFPKGNGEPVQHIYPPGPVQVARVDFSTVPESEHLENLSVFIDTQLGGAFDLEKGSLLRAGLIYLGEKTFILILSLHHILTDGWSTSLIIQEFGELVSALSEGRAPQLKPLPFQYADYAIWQRRSMEYRLMEEQRLFWTQQLAEAPNLLEIPTDLTRPAIQSHYGGRIGFSIAPEVETGLEKIGGLTGTTPFMFYQTAFAVLLSFYSGQHDVLIGTPIANRKYAGLESLIGMFVNTLVIRNRTHGNPTLRELLHRTRKTTLNSFANQDYPFEQIVELLRPQRSMSHHPIFQVMFNFHKVPRTKKGSGMALMLMESDEVVTTKFDLTLSISQTSILRGSMEYRADLFEKTTIEAMIQDYLDVLQAMTLHLDAPIASLTRLRDEKVLRALSMGPDLIMPETRPVHQMMIEMAVANPNRMAVCLPDGTSLTYDLLNRWSDGVAALLAANGVAAERLVVIRLKGGLSLYPAILGTLKAGGAFVMADPQVVPDKRIAFMLEDTGAPVLLTDDGFHQELPSHVTLLTMPGAGAASASFTPVNVDPKNLAYLVYTSGTTGKPKGVAVSHAQLFSLLYSYLQVAPKPDGFAASSVCPLGFDVFVWETFHALCFGGTLHLLPNELITLPESYAQYLRDHKVECAYIPPNLLEVLIPFLEKAPVALRRLVLGVESIEAGLLVRYQALHPEIMVQNMYGPAETTILATRYILEETRQSKSRAPIGKPMPGYQLTVMSANLEPVLAGAPGEAFIGGVCVSRGYFGRPALTAERFIPDPISGNPGARMYKTGDKMRRDKKGNLIFINRVDAQVKHRGFRIEPAEIESCMMDHPKVREAVVLVRNDPGFPECLVGYLVPDKESLETREVIAHLKLMLPHYMVPSYLVVLDAIPLTSNGKQDRRALSAPNREVKLASRGELDATEEMVLGFSADLLELEKVTPDSNFFELGGHSLLASQLISRIRDGFGVNLSLNEVFAAENLGALAARVRLVDQQAEMPRPVRADRGEQIPLSYAQQRLWFVEKTSANPGSYKISFDVAIHGPLDVALLERSLSAVLARHEVLRTHFIDTNTGPTQVVTPHGTWTLPCQTLPQDQPRESAIAQLSKTFSAKPFDLDKGPLVRALLVTLDEKEHLLFLALHHIIADGWSFNVLVRETALHYEAFSEDREPNPPALPLQYADYAIWQRNLFQGPFLDRELAYWEEQLANLTPVRKLPLAVEQNADLPGGCERFEFPESLGIALQAACRREGVTLYMMLLTGLKTLFFTHTGEKRQVIGTDIANRHYLEVENLIGFFINQFALSTDFGGIQLLDEVLPLVKRNTLNAYAHQDLPFDLLVEKLNPTRIKGVHPFFQVKLVLQNLPDPKIMVSDLSFTTQPGGERTAKLAMQMNMWHVGNRMGGTLDYGQGRYDQPTILRLLRHFQYVLQRLASSTQTPLQALPALLAESDREEEKAQLKAIQKTGFPKFNRPKKKFFRQG